MNGLWCQLTGGPRGGGGYETTNFVSLEIKGDDDTRRKIDRCRPVESSIFTTTGIYYRTSVFPVLLHCVDEVGFHLGGCVAVVTGASRATDADETVRVIC